MTLASTGLRVTKRKTLNRCNGCYAHVLYLIMYINLPLEWSDSEKQCSYVDNADVDARHLHSAL
jgi:hypothetical protein